MTYDGAMTWRSFISICVLALGTACSSADDADRSEARPGSASAAIPAPPDVAAPPADAERTASGLAYKVLTPGTGTTRPKPQSIVVAHYTGWTREGKMIDSSVARGEPLTYQLAALIPGWIEGMQMMVAGEKRRFWIPGSLAYDSSQDPRAPKGMLVFDIELLEVR